MVTPKCSLKLVQWVCTCLGPLSVTLDFDRWKLNNSKCYWTQKPLEPFRIYPLHCSCHFFYWLTDRWTLNSSKCYWKQKPLEPFRIYPLHCSCHFFYWLTVPYIFFLDQIFYNWKKNHLCLKNSSKPLKKWKGHA